jgi:hypothetical protein
MARQKLCTLCEKPITGKTYFHAQPDPEDPDIECLVPICGECAAATDPDKMKRDMNKKQSN